MSAPRPPRLPWLPRPRPRTRTDKGLAPVLVAVAFLVALALAAGAALWVARARHGRAAPPPEPTASVTLLAPLGGIPATPRAFTWKPVPSAASYKVTIGDADAVWPMFVRTTTAISLPLDEKDSAAISAGRIHMWEVVALDAAGNPLAHGAARFRVGLPGENAVLDPPF